jgi:purine-binding chemotaxis protein CheW
MNVTTESEIKSRSTGSLAGKYLTFILAGDSFGIPVLKVREIIRHTIIRAVPGMPDYVCGVINLRGKIIPVLDLRLRFGLPAASNNDQTCIVVVQVATGDSRTVATGLVVDGVEEVVQIASSDIELTPHFGGCGTADYLLGMAKVKGVVKALLDIDHAVGSTALAQLRLAARQTNAA